MYIPPAKPRDSKIIVKDIWDFDLHQSPNRPAGDKSSPLPFKELLETTIAESGVNSTLMAKLEGTNPDHILVQVRDAWPDYKNLDSALQAIGTRELKHAEKLALKDAANLIGLLAEETAFLGGDSHDESTSPAKPFRALLDRGAAEQGKTRDEAQEQYKQEASSVAKERAIEARNLREEIIPRFRELAQALAIAFNRPDRGAGF